MTTRELEQVKWHLRVPACRTMHGCRMHLRLIPVEEVRLLCRYFNCDANEIEERFWLAVKKRTVWL